jgi:hypothetical protein
MPSPVKLFSVVTLILSLITFMAQAAAAPDCHNVDSTGDRSLQYVSLPPPNGCGVRMSNGYPIPDPSCTPGGINPTVTITVLRDPAYRTRCTRDSGTSAAQKSKTYTWYKISHPSNNTGARQTCELDHLISLELGGADTLDNIWPQCGPPGVPLIKRYFKQKDLVENYLAAEVKAGNIDLTDAQYGIARDWTQYLEASKQYYAQHRAASHRGAIRKTTKHKSRIS